MTAQFRLTKTATNDIEQITDFIAQQSGLQQSETFLSKLDAKFANIVTFPQIGRKRSEILPNLRSVPLDKYLILYLLIGEDVEILRVVSGYRDLARLFTEPEE
jgi:toxin ParE1/3/4